MYLPDADEMADVEVICKQAQPLIDCIIDGVSCVFGFAYEDRWKQKHYYTTTDPDDLLEKIDYRVDPRDWNQIMVVVFQDRAGNRAYYRYKEALAIMTYGVPVEGYDGNQYF